MVIPVYKHYAVSAITRENKEVSLHLIHTFGEMMDYLDASEFYLTPPDKRGTWLESLEEGESFEFSNPLITTDAQQMFDFINCARIWGENRWKKKNS